MHIPHTANFSLITIFTRCR